MSESLPSNGEGRNGNWRGGGGQVETVQSCFLNELLPLDCARALPIEFVSRESSGADDKLAPQRVFKGIRVLVLPGCSELSVNDLQMKELQDQLEAENYFSVSFLCRPRDCHVGWGRVVG